MQKRGVTNYPGLYFVGLPRLHNASRACFAALKNASSITKHQRFHILTESRTKCQQVFPHHSVGVNRSRQEAVPTRRQTFFSRLSMLALAIRLTDSDAMNDCRGRLTETKKGYPGSPPVQERTTYRLARKIL
jgi:hypothetical protein